MSEMDTKRIIGLYGEMCLAMELHNRGWQVYRAYIDEQIDFIITRYYCTKCKSFSDLEKRKNKNRSFPTNLCKTCKEDSLKIAVRFIQAKASAGIKDKKIKQCAAYSFHANLRSNVDDRAFYAWIALPKIQGKYEPHFYIFNHREIEKFDNLRLASYQKTDNQKTTLRIDDNGKVLNKGRIHSYDDFNDDFYNNFDKLDMLGVI